jgi:uncharacterized protein with von Willebrand factor type A (vWA) domain
MRVPPRVHARLRLIAPAIMSSGPTATPESGAESLEVTRRTYSTDEVWRRKDFAEFTAADVARAAEVIGRTAWNPGQRRTRRWQPRGHEAIDFRRLLALNVRHGGEPIRIAYRRRREAPRPLIVISDISGSMEPYTRMLLLFAHLMAASERRVEVFLFSTSLTRVTRQFAARAVSVALARVRDAVRDWSGGTRIGAALFDFNRHWARRVLRGRPVVLLISDGWDLGEPALLGREVARLQRGAFRLIWLNPLIGSPGYEPLTRGLQAALPHVDDFLSVRDMASLDVLAAHLGTLSARARRRPAATLPWK